MSDKLRLAGILVILLLVGMGSTASAQDKSLVWQRYDVNIRVQPDSDMLVEEIQRIQFTSGSFHYGFAAIPLDRVERIADVTVAEEIGGVEKAYAPGYGGDYGFVSSEHDGNLEINWYFPSTADSIHTYVLRYRVVGGLRMYDQGDQVFWKAIAPDHNFPVRASRVTVTLPRTFSPEELVIASYGASATHSVGGDGQVVFEAANIGADRELEVRVQFPHGVVQGSAPSWQSRQERIEQQQYVLTVIFAVLGALLLIAGPAAVFAYWFARGWDQPSPTNIAYLADPPDNLPAGMAGALVDEKAELKDVIASIVDLARRGILRMEEVKKKTPDGGHSRPDFVFHLQDASKATRPFEQTLLAAIFAGQDQKRLAALRHTFYLTLPKLQGQILDELVKEGFFPKNPQKVRNAWIGWGILALVVAGVLACVLLSVPGDYKGWAIFPGVSLVATAITLIVASQILRFRTAKGVEETSKWLAFKQYLKNVEKWSDLDVVKDRFESFLPYAVAFGLERRVIDQFEKVDTGAPTWWGPVSSSVPVGEHPGHGGSGTAHEGEPEPLAGQGNAESVPGLPEMSRAVGMSLSSMSDGLGSMLRSAGTILSGPPPSRSSGSRSSSGHSSFGGGGGGGGGGGSRGFG